MPAGTTSRYPVPNLRHGASNHGALSLPHYIPSAEMRDENLVDEQRGLGSLTERIVAAVVGDRATSKNVKEAVSGKENDEDAHDNTRVDVVIMEDRMKKELKSVMLLGENEEVSLTEWVALICSMTRKHGTTTRSRLPYANASDYSTSRPRSTMPASLAWLRLLDNG